MVIERVLDGSAFLWALPDERHLMGRGQALLVFVQNWQRLLDAKGALSSACQTLQIPDVPWHPLKFRQLLQR